MLESEHTVMDAKEKKWKSDRERYSRMSNEKRRK